MMVSEPTQQQLAALAVAPNKPLIICDVDEVVVHFIRDFENFIAADGFYLTPGDPSQPYELRQKPSNTALAQEQVFKLVNEFFIKQTKHMLPIAGAVQGLQNLSAHASIVMLTNLPHFAGDDRRKNLGGLGLDFPVITNSGPKGPALAEIASRTTGPTLFIDDSAGFITSAYEHAPHVELVHFLHDQRFAPYVPHLEFAGLRCSEWASVEQHVLAVLDI